MREKGKVLIIITAFILVAMVVLHIAGIRIQFTTGLSSKEMFKIDRQVCTFSEGKLYLANTLEQYKQTYGEELLKQDFKGITAEEFLKEHVLAKLAKVKILSNMSEKWEVSLSKTDEGIVKNATERYMKSLGEKNAEKLGITEKEIRKMYEEYLLAEKTFAFLTEGEEVEISEDEARIIVVWHIYFKAYDKNEAGEIVPYGKEEKQKVLGEANKVLGELRAGGDFATAAKEYSDDAVYEYEIGRGEMGSEFDLAAFELETGELSNLVETPYGYHIIKCISDFEEDKSKLNKEQMLQKKQYENYEEIYEAYTKEVTTTFNEKKWKKITLEEVDLGCGDFFSILEECKAAPN